jgi:tRNA A-37 threonylcarbamoyl transferase component Bud32
MDRDQRLPRELGPYEATVDAVSPDSLLPLADCCPRVHLVEGSGGGLSCETQELLRYRLRASSVILCGGFALFLIWSLLYFKLNEPREAMLFASHVAVTMVLGACGSALCRRCVITTRALRIYELVIFGLPAVHFLFMQYVNMTECAAQHGTLPNVASPWLMLIFMYAMFIPNTWRRAAAVVGSFALAPVIMSSLLIVLDHACRAANDGLSFTSQLSLVMLIAGVASTVGVHSIGTLRREAFEARQLGQYKLGRLLGSGGMGEVYLAEHQLMKRPCAIKVIRPEKAGDPRALARFEREVRLTAKLSHWNSIDIFDYGRADDGTFYYVMEYLPGMSLSELVKRYGALPADRVIHLLRQTSVALAEAHGIGLIHRDIKPGNIFAAQRGGLYDVAKLLDFGLAKPLAAEDDSAQLTQEGMITGSPLFMSPEQATGDHEPDARSDIYALGAVAYYLLTARPPFDSDKPLKVLVALTHETPVPPSEINSDVPADLSHVVMRCLAKRPDERYQSALDLAAALDDCQAAGRWTHESAARWWREHAGQSREAIQV